MKKTTNKRLRLEVQTIRELETSDGLIVRGAAILLSHLQQGCNTSPLMCGSLVGH